ncbi:MAG: hypothetical protein KY453_07210, partial [Gemmatimonadetes bacterium]|nr:hypothetical protein [Gemmatimonadota bacterium]
TARARPVAAPHGAPARLPPLGQRIAVARDAAFGFAYWHMLEDWRAAGAEIVPFSPLADQPPDAGADAVFLPGGYPELHAGRLAGNRRFLDGLGTAAERGTLIYGECGGFMVLGEHLIDADGHAHAMAGLVPLTTSFATRQLSLGYREMRHAGALPDASAKARAARTARFPEGAPGTARPSTSSATPGSARVTRTRSARSMAWRSVCTSWYPSARRGPTRRDRFTLAGASRSTPAVWSAGSTRASSCAAGGSGSRQLAPFGPRMAAASGCARSTASSTRTSLRSISLRESPMRQAYHSPMSVTGMKPPR